MEELSKAVAAGFPDEWYGMGTEHHFWFLWRLAALKTLLAENAIPVQAPLRVLEVGCGTGSLRAQVEGMTRWTVDGADLNEPALRDCRPGRGRTLLYNVEDRHPALLHSYDGLLLFDVVEHIAEPNSFLRASLEHLKPGGWLIINVPASMALHSRYDQVVGHYRRYSLSSMAAALQALTADNVTVHCLDLRYWGLSLYPIALARKHLLRWVKDDAEVVRIGFRPPAKIVNELLCQWMRLETALCSKPVVGTSVLALARVS